MLRLFIIPPNHHGHGLELSGPCQFNKSEFLLNQYSQSASLQLYGQVWNDDSHAAISTTAPDPDWWTDNINSEAFSDEVHQDCRIALASVSPEIPCANEVGTASVLAAFQTTSQPSGFCQQSFGFNVPASFDIDFEREALLAYPDGATCKVVQNSISLVQSDWNSMKPSSARRSRKKSKSQFSSLRPFKCPQCFKPFPSERHLGYHIQESHSKICGFCGRGFGLSKDLKRHQDTTSCLNGSAPTRPFACTCGKRFARKDHLQRHISNTIGRSEDDKHLVVQVCPSN